VVILSLSSDQAPRSLLLCKLGIRPKFCAHLQAEHAQVYLRNPALQVVFGCGNDKFGGCGSILDINAQGCGGCGASPDAGAAGILTLGAQRQK